LEEEKPVDTARNNGQSFEKNKENLISEQVFSVTPSPVVGGSQSCVVENGKKCPSTPSSLSRVVKKNIDKSREVQRNLDMESPVSVKQKVCKESFGGWELAVANYSPQTKRQLQINTMVSTCSLIFSGDYIETFIHENEEDNQQSSMYEMLSKFLPMVHLGFNFEESNIKGVSCDGDKCVVCFDSQETAQKILINKRFLQDHKIFVLPFLNKEESFFQGKLVDEFRKFRTKVDDTNFNFSVYKKVIV